MSNKQKWPLAAAQAVAEELRALLDPCCERIIVAGSIRRRKAEVGDVELLFVPKMALAGDDFFAPASQTEPLLEDFLKRGVLKKRPNVNGGTAWGASNKLAVHVASGMPVDLFATSLDAWWNYLVCRTGGAENNVAIASAAQRRGWKWNPYGEGFSRPRGVDEEPEVVAMGSEREVFDFVRLPYLEPEERR